ncbi:Hypothetical predicted protein [Olea europaea subsp. europaea]|uniref:BEACH domain-containing protein n=1 Tax=Olea europaea subsp. europaea TaxID=158383 RepID=A0A8S0SQK1_OLEEU|nr:Hypothetical predicted protein [Olea europaea subsp. europaea]
MVHGEISIDEQHDQLDEVTSPSPTLKKRSEQDLEEVAGKSSVQEKKLEYVMQWISLIGLNEEKRNKEKLLDWATTVTGGEPHNHHDPTHNCEVGMGPCWSLGISLRDVFPWILSDYSSDKLDLYNRAFYGDLSQPIGYSSFDDPIIPKFHDDSHYYPSRLEDLTTLSTQLQGPNHFDLANRMFPGIAAT